MTPFTPDEGSLLEGTPPGAIQLGAVGLVALLAQADDLEPGPLVVIGLVQLAAFSDAEQLPVESRIARGRPDVSVGRVPRQDAFSEGRAARRNWYAAARGRADSEQ